MKSVCTDDHTFVSSAIFMCLHTKPHQATPGGAGPRLPSRQASSLGGRSQMEDNVRSQMDIVSCQMVEEGQERTGLVTCQMIEIRKEEEKMSDDA